MLFQAQVGDNKGSKDNKVKKSVTVSYEVM